METNQNNKKKSKNINGKWKYMSQIEIYKITREPKPQVAIREGNDRKFHKNSAAYPWNNEPASKLREMMSYKGKKGFGVLASGDQVFIFLQNGLGSYLGFDISQVACFWNELKSEAVKNLRIDEFIYFTCGKEGLEECGITERFSSTTKDIYHELKKNITPYARKFFDKIIIGEYKKRNCIEDILRDGRFFRGDCFEFDASEAPYLKSKEEYEKLRQSLKKAPYKFIWKELNGAIDTVDGEKFDIIFISNILDRWEQFGNDFKDILLKMKSILNKTKDARIIGNYQLGQGAGEHINEVVEKTGLIFTPHTKVSSDYWTLKHSI